MAASHASSPSQDRIPPEGREPPPTPGPSPPQAADARPRLSRTAIPEYLDRPRDVTGAITPLQEAEPTPPVAADPWTRARPRVYLTTCRREDEHFAQALRLGPPLAGTDR